MGRYKAFKEPHVPVATTVPERVMEDVRRIAGEEDRSVAWMLRHFIQEGVKARTEKAES